MAFKEGNFKILTKQKKRIYLANVIIISVVLTILFQLLITTSLVERGSIFDHNGNGSISSKVFSQKKGFWCKHSTTFVSNLLNLDILILVL